MKARKDECWFYFLEAEKQLVKAALESSLPLGLEASVTQTTHLMHKGAIESEPLFLVSNMLGSPCFSWCEQLFLMMDGGAGVGGSQRKDMGNKSFFGQAHTAVLRTRTKWQHPALTDSPLTLCRSLNNSLSCLVQRRSWDSQPDSSAQGRMARIQERKI